jgi:hypothetical protein
VKWLSQTTAGGLAAVFDNNPATPGSQPVMSRMLGGLQFSTFPSDLETPGRTANEGCPYLGCTGCLVTFPKGVQVCVAATLSCAAASTCDPSPPSCAPSSSSGSCTPLSSTNAPVEQALLNVFQMYFAGTTATKAFAAPGTITNNATTVSGAPMHYLQIWYPDIDYAAGFGSCPRQYLMTSTPTTCSGFTPPASMPKVPVSPLANALNAQLLIGLAGNNIPTTPGASPPFGYNNGSDRPCTCKSPYVERHALDGDLVCVPKLHKKWAADENAEYKKHYSINETISVPYGVCKPNHVWRQAHMGDYVCVSTVRAAFVAADNALGSERFECP